MLGACCYGASGETGDKIVTNKNKEENHIHKTKGGWKHYWGCNRASEAWKSTGHLVLSAQAESQDKGQA